MNALKKYFPGPLRDPNVWLNRLSGEANANRARATVVDNEAKSYPFVARYSDFVSGLASALKGGGGVFRELEAPLYPYRDAHAHDLNCLGADMYAAFLSHSTAEMANARRTRSGNTTGHGTR